MELKKLLAYQELDKKLYRIENEYQKSPEVMKLVQLQKDFKDEKARMQQLTKEVGDLIASFPRIDAKLDNLVEYEDSIDIEELDLITDLAELNACESNINKYQDAITTIEKEASKIMRRLSEIKSEYQKCNERLYAINANYKKFKVIHDEKQKEMQASALPIMKELKALAGELDATLMQKYLERRKAKKMPAFVPYIDGNCSGCGMNIEVEVSKYLQKSGDIKECPECRRMVYMP